MIERTFPNTEVYDERYKSSDYRQRLTGFEVARWNALRHFIRKVIRSTEKPRVLDYGAGAGLHVELWEECFNESKLHFCDISSAAQARFVERFPRYQDTYTLMADGVAPHSEATFDIVVSVEVMEHVEDLDGYLQDIYRVLSPGGVFVWTTPCGNRGSLEHLWAALTQQIKQTDEGYRVWAWEDPTHIRRLRTGEIDSRLLRAGFSSTDFRLRSHFFSFVGTYFPPRHRLNFLREKMMGLDYRLFRRLTNGASMLGAAYKSRSA